MRHALRDSDVTEFIHAMGLLVRRGRALNVGQQFSLTETAVMARLATDGAATIASLARFEGVKPQSMGTVIAKLEAAGLVRRKPHATDGRQMNIELTARGLATRQDADRTRRAWLIKALEKLDNREQDALFAASAVMRRLAE